jgi:hypothetical protein
MNRVCAVLAREVFRQTVEGAIIGIIAGLESRHISLFRGTSTAAFRADFKVVNAKPVGDDRVVHFDAEADFQLTLAIPRIGELKLDVKLFVRIGIKSNIVRSPLHDRNVNVVVEDRSGACAAVKEVKVQESPLDTNEHLVVVVMAINAIEIEFNIESIRCFRDSKRLGNIRIFLTQATEECGETKILSFETIDPGQSLASLKVLGVCSTTGDIINLRSATRSGTGPSTRTGRSTASASRSITTSASRSITAGASSRW